MAGLSEGGNEPPGSFKAVSTEIITGSGYPEATARHHTHWDNGQTTSLREEVRIKSHDFTTGNRTQATLIRSPERYLKTEEVD
ncbi:hypothetical protein ANN_14195 [Periplaneta americana]|uniref:Uncharacterized protein n=1 Tax=Periplaneta americana TaxID=6978 RepID=A0ABQ8SX01_PERAM|nr:hypothetical protein ANN_14195 [Periplaneta americana]